MITTSVDPVMTEGNHSQRRGHFTPINRVSQQLSPFSTLHIFLESVHGSCSLLGHLDFTRLDTLLLVISQVPTVPPYPPTGPFDPGPVVPRPNHDTLLPYDRST